MDQSLITALAVSQSPASMHTHSPPLWFLYGSAGPLLEKT